jgi:transposase-like protein
MDMYSGMGLRIVLKKGGREATLTLDCNHKKPEIIIPEGYSSVTYVHQKAGFCPKCGLLTTHKNGTYGRKYKTKDGPKYAVIERLRCCYCRSALPAPELDDVDKHAKYGNDVKAHAIEHGITYCLPSRDVANEIKKATQGKAVPTNPTVWNWLIRAGDSAESILKTEIFPKLGSNTFSDMHMDELYQTTTFAGDKLPVFISITPMWLCTDIRITEVADSSEVKGILRGVIDWLWRVRRLISDGLDIYPKALEELINQGYIKIEHLSCEFHLKRNINRKRKQLETTEDPKERKRLRTLIKRDENTLKQQKEARERWKKEYGTEFITNNIVEWFIRFIKRALRRIVSFGNIRLANAYLSLFRFYWDFRKFQRGKYAGLSPLEINGFDTQGKTWIQWLGY